jgi:hypothetical protein
MNALSYWLGERQLGLEIFSLHATKYMYRGLGRGYPWTIGEDEGCVVSCVVTLRSLPLGVNPQGETDLNDTRAIGLTLGCPLPSRG